MAQAKTKKAQGKPKRTTATKKTQPVAVADEPKKKLFERRQRVTEAERQAAKSGYTKLPAAYKLLGRACKLLGQHWKLFGGVLLVYALLNVLLVGVAGAGSLQQSKNTLEQAAHGGLSNLSVGFTLFSSLIGSDSSSNANGGAYQTMLLLLISVAFIWALRQVYAGHVVRIRDAFYSGVYPVVPFILILLVIGLQLLPIAIGGVLYGTMVGGGITVGVFEQIVALAIFLALAAWSLYMLCASILALYIVTLPDMAPMKALKSARQLVRFRRWIVLRKLLFLPLALIVIVAVIVIPFALFVAPLATLSFFVLSVLAVGVLHSYLYALYRELL
ncbi:MAG TPA: hypothetical protein VGG13_03580 [Candidatus Saccharimonadales bacterium]